MIPSALPPDAGRQVRVIEALALRLFGHLLEDPGLLGVAAAELVPLVSGKPLPPGLGLVPLQRCNGSVQPTIDARDHEVVGQDEDAHLRHLEGPDSVQLRLQPLSQLVNRMQIAPQ